MGEIKMDLDQQHIDSLPDEVLDFILSLVSSYGDLRQCYQVCHRWRDSVLRVAHNHKVAILRDVPEMKLLWSSSSCEGGGNNELTISKRYSHSAIYDDDTLSMYVFGGCTSTSTTFNDLWIFDLTTKNWRKPRTTGAYPTPKACSALVKYQHEEMQQDLMTDMEGIQPLRKKSSLFLFGGWTHPSIYPLHQTWRLFNELHRYDIDERNWTAVHPATPVKPPPMAGHSATVHFGLIVVFAGLQKQRSTIGQFQSSSDVWTFDIKTSTWAIENIPEPRPKPRYGQSQLYLDETHLLILGGCEGPNNLLNDVWLLIMEPPFWRWVECKVKNAEKYGAAHMWCHPACKIGNYAVILGKDRPSAVVYPPQATSHREARWNVIPQLRRGLNRGYGAIRRPNNPLNNSRQNSTDRPHGQRTQSLDEDSLRAQSEDLRGARRPRDVNSSPDPGEHSSRRLQSRTKSDERMEVAVYPVESRTLEHEGSPPRSFKSTVTLHIDPTNRPQSTAPVSSQNGGEGDVSHPSPSSSVSGSLGPSLPKRPPIQIDYVLLPRMQAFAPNTPLAAFHGGAASGVAGGAGAATPPRHPATSATRKQIETRQRQLETLRRMEERYKNLNKERAQPSGPSNPDPAEQRPANSGRACPRQAEAGVGVRAGRQEVRDDEKKHADDDDDLNTKCSCRLAMYVLDISRAMNPEPVVEWLPFRSNVSCSAPEDTILYTLVVGRSELIMFGGLQKEVGATMPDRPGSDKKNTVFNNVYFLTPPIYII